MIHAFGIEYLESEVPAPFMGGSGSPLGLSTRASYRAQPIPFDGLVTELDPADVQIL